jgi:2-keto-4-pentenoate hydratase
MRDDGSLLDWLESHLAGAARDGDLLDRSPNLTDADAYRLQFALADRRAARGDRLLGYKAAHTSLAIQEERGRGVSVGTLLGSYLLTTDEPISLSGGGSPCIEPEIAVRIARELSGPGLTATDALGAVDAIYPAIEIVTPQRGHKRSQQMGIALSKTSGGFIVGRQSNAPHGIDLRVEGVVVSVNGRPLRSATGVEALGHPFNVVAAVANLLGQHQRSLKPGMIVLTGSLTNNIPVESGDEFAVEFTRIGSIRGKVA